MGQVLQFRSARRQRGFIELPDPRTVFAAGVAAGLVLGIILTLAVQWLLSHLSIGWQ